MSFAAHFDGDYTKPFMVGPVLVEDLVDTISRLYRVKFHWLSAELAKKKNKVDYNSVGAKGTPMERCPLVEQTAAKDLGGGVCEYDCTFAEIPKTRIVPEATSYGYQYVNGGLAETAIPITGTATYTYWFTSAAQRISVGHPSRLVSIAGVIFRAGPANMLADGETVTRWKGNIWEKRSMTYPAIAIALDA